MDVEAAVAGAGLEPRAEGRGPSLRPALAGPAWTGTDSRTHFSSVAAGVE